MKLIDANLIIRYLTIDDRKKALAVKRLLESSQEELLLPDVILAEIVWTLASFYKFEKKDVVEKLQALLLMDSIRCNYNLLQRSLVLYKSHNISFIDSYLSAYAIEKELGIYSYDKDIDKVKLVKRFEP